MGPFGLKDKLKTKNFTKVKIDQNKSNKLEIHSEKLLPLKKEKKKKKIEEPKQNQ